MDSALKMKPKFYPATACGHVHGDVYMEGEGVLCWTRQNEKKQQKLNFN